MLCSGFGPAKDDHTSTINHTSTDLNSGTNAALARQLLRIPAEIFEIIMLNVLNHSDVTSTSWNEDDWEHANDYYHAFADTIFKGRAEIPWRLWLHGRNETMTKSVHMITNGTVTDAFEYGVRSAFDVYYQVPSTRTRINKKLRSCEKKYVHQQLLVPHEDLDARNAELVKSIEACEEVIRFIQHYAQISRITTAAVEQLFPRGLPTYMPYREVSELSQIRTDHAGQAYLHPRH